MRHLQELHERFREKGLAILGFNSADDREIALQFMAENGATFPTILDPSDAAVKIGFGDYHATGVPVNYVIDREGKVVDAWYGYEHGHTRALAALKKAGGPLAEAIREKEQAAEGTPSLLRSLFDTIRKALEN
jgi:peroxiredoxin